MNAGPTGITQINGLNHLMQSSNMFALPMYGNCFGKGLMASGLAMSLFLSAMISNHLLSTLIQIHTGASLAEKPHNQTIHRTAYSSR